MLLTLHCLIVILFYCKIMYSELSPNGSLKLYHFIAMVTVVMIVISQLPTFHSLRHINFVSLLLSLGYSFLVVGACAYAGTSSFSIPSTSSFVFCFHALLKQRNYTHVSFWPSFMQQCAFSLVQSFIMFTRKKKKSK